MNLECNSWFSSFFQMYVVRKWTNYLWSNSTAKRLPNYSVAIYQIHIVSIPHAFRMFYCRVLKFLLALVGRWNKDDTDFWAKDVLGTWKDWILRMMKRTNFCLYSLLYDRMYRSKMKVTQSTCTHGESNVTAYFIGILYIFHFFCFVQQPRKLVEWSVFGMFCCIRFRFFSTERI